MLSSHTRSQKAYLKIFQANVARGQANHDLAIALAYTDSADVILIQEPWIFAEREKRITKQHREYDVFCPQDSWDIRPRVMTYIRKGRNLQPAQLRPIDTGDICWVSILGCKPQISIVNIYRPPLEREGGAVITALKQWRVSPNSLIAGDFNLRHPYWDSKSKSSKRSEELVEWAQQNTLVLASPANERTHNRGSVIDLVFTNIIGAHSCVEEHLHTTSDHETLISIIPLNGHDRRPLQGKFILTPESIPRFISGIKETIEPFSKSTEDPDRLANLITEAIKINMERFLPLKRSKRQGTQWWNLECREKAAAYRQARRQGEALKEKQDLRRATRAAKREHWHKFIQNANCPADIFKITSWHKKKGVFSYPPITHDGQVFVDPISKANVLRKTLLERRTTEDDVNYNEPMLDIQPRIQIKKIVDVFEAEQCLIHTSGKAPGIDGITVNILRACWDGIKEAVALLYQRCLDLGYHPRTFKRTEIIVLPKPNKRDLSSVRSWRPIALLSCLGKGLERLVARRLSRAALTHGVLSKQQFGALPKRSASDLVGCIIHEIEIARSRSKMASLLTLDIKGAFDTVLPGRMLKRLEDQGWPRWVMKWVGSFMNNRTARIRLGESTTQETPLRCGLPQGSPVSPILFMLYTEPILRLGDRKMKFSYADDVAILQIGNTLRECAEKLEREAQLLFDWGVQNAISFDLDKCELQHFTLAPKPKEYPEIILGEVVLPPNQVTRWLGVWLDRKLSFLPHTRHWAAKGAAIAAHLHRINRATKGAPPHLIRQAVKTCILPTIFYGIEAWWPGKHVLSWNRGREKELIHRSQLHLKTLSKVLHLALRAIVPSYRTIPLPALYREAGIPPTHIILDEIRLRKSLRLQTLDHNHPLRIRANGKRSSRLTQTLQLLPISIDSHLCNMEEDAANILPALKPTDHDIYVYTDGARTSEGGAGAASVIYQAGRKVYSQKTSIEIKVEALDTELIAIKTGLQTAIQKAITRFATNIIVFTDSQIAASIVNGKKSYTSLEAVSEIRTIQRTWIDRNKLPHIRPGCIAAHWIPGHSGIRGNEEANYLAKLSARESNLNLVENKLTHAAVKQQALSIRTDIGECWWNSNAPKRYKALKLNISPPGKFPKELRLQRPIISLLIAARSGHGDFKTYHERFSHRSYSDCSCGAEKTPTHFFFCKNRRKKVRQEIGKRRPQEAIDWLLGSAEGAAAFGRIMKNN